MLRSPDLRVGGQSLGAVELQLDGDPRLGFALLVETAGHGALPGLRHGCDRLIADGQALRCERGWLALARQPDRGALTWHAAGSVGGADLRRVPLAGGTLDATLDWRQSTAGWALAAHVHTEELGLASADGRAATEGLQLVADIDYASGSGRLDGRVRVAAGGLYLDPVYVAAEPGAGLALDWRGQLHDGRLRLLAFHYDDGQGSSIRGSGAWQADTGLAGLDLVVDRLELDAASAYARYLQPWLLGRLGGELRVSGRLRGSARWHGEPSALALTVEDLDLAHADGRFAWRGLDARIDWQRDGPMRASGLRWSEGQFYRIEVGPGAATVLAAGGRFVLDRPVRAALLGGEMRLLAMQGDGLLDGGLQWQAEAEADGIDLAALTEALDWTRFDGQASVRTGRLRYADRQLVLDGALVASAFGGNLVLRGLRIDDPMGLIPRARASLQISGLDLDALTRTFAFGRIQGRLDGAVEGLELERWVPVRFDAWLASPAGGRERRRISQQAVDSLSSLGGGGSLVSRGFLGLFEDFGYRRLGLRCVLRGGVCTLDGVAPAGAGYYLVEGAGLPRIDVVGHTREVNWVELLARLRAAASSEGPVIE